MLSPYSRIIQGTLGPTNYLRDFKRQEEYLREAALLPYLNNEIEHPKASQNKKRFESLNSLTMIKFNKDPIIYPIISSWFGQFDSSGKLIPMEQTKIYKHNLFGLKTLDE